MQLNNEAELVCDVDLLLYNIILAQKPAFTEFRHFVQVPFTNPCAAWLQLDLLVRALQNPLQAVVNGDSLPHWATS